MRPHCDVRGYRYEISENAGLRVVREIDNPQYLRVAIKTFKEHEVVLTEETFLAIVKKYLEFKRDLDEDLLKRMTNTTTAPTQTQSQSLP